MGHLLAVRERLNKRVGKQCSVPGCYHYVNKFSQFCKHHDQVNQRTGHPQGRTISIGELKTYRTIAREFLEKNIDHPSVASAKDFLVGFLSDSTPPKSIGARTPPRVRLRYWRHALWSSAIDPLDMLAVIVGMFLLRHYDLRAFRSDRHFWHQTVVRLFRLAKPIRDAGAGHAYHKRITVGERELFTDIMKKSRLMTLGHVVSQEIINIERKAQLPQVEGIRTPFISQQHKDN